MAQGLAAYTGPNEQGAGTILVDTEKSGFLDYALKVPQIRAKQRQEEQDRLMKLYDEIKPGDAWRRFQPSINEKWGELTRRLTEGIREGAVDRGAFQRTILEIKSMENASTQLQSEFDKITQSYRGDKRVLNDAIEELVGRHVGKGSMEDLRQAAASTIDADFFLQEKGGSKYLNTDETVNHVLKNSFNEWIEKKVQTVGEKAAAGLGLLEWDKNTKTYKVKSFTEVDANGNVKVKSVDALLESNIADVFESDPYMNRIIIDRANDWAKLAGRESPNMDDKALALRSILKGREVGISRDEKDRATARTSVDFGGRQRAEQASDLQQWMRDFRAGKKIAYDYGVGAKMQGDEIISTQAPGSFPSAIPGYRFKTGGKLEVFTGDLDAEGNPETRTIPFDPQNMTDEEMILLYNRASKERETLYKEFSVDNLELIDQVRTIEDIE